MKGKAVDIRDQEIKKLKNWKIDTTFILRQNFQRIDELERRINTLSKTNTVVGQCHFAEVSKMVGAHLRSWPASGHEKPRPA